MYVDSGTRTGLVPNQLVVACLEMCINDRVPGST
jgi:hypothetical protein